MAKIPSFVDPLAELSANAPVLGDAELAAMRDFYGSAAAAHGADGKVVESVGAVPGIEQI